MSMDSLQVVSKPKPNLPVDVNKNIIKFNGISGACQGDARQPRCFSMSLSKFELIMMLYIRQRLRNNNPNMKNIFYLSLGDQAGMTR